MIYQEIPLNGLLSDWDQSDENARLTLYLQQPSAEWSENAIFPCVLICPGGGYEMTSDREAEPVALKYAGMGYSVAVLRYSTNHRHFPVQLCELSMAMVWLRRNAAQFCLNAQQIAVCGFSAGGHLAASLCNLYDLPLLQEAMPMEKGENRPDAAILGYPVISTGSCAHVGSFQNLFGNDLDENTRQILSLENSVHENCPPCFIWHTADDDCVPSENSLLYALALKHCNVPFELHLYPHGPHGLSLCDCTTSNLPTHKLADVAAWFALSVRFLDKTLAVSR